MNVERGNSASLKERNEMKYLLNTVETNVSDPDNIDYSPFGETLVDV